MLTHKQMWDIVCQRKGVVRGWERIGSPISNAHTGRFRDSEQIRECQGVVARGMGE